MLKPTALPAQQKGTIFLTLLFGLPVLLVVVGLAVDFGHYYQVERQAQTAADAGAWGGALQRGRGITQNGELDIELIKNAAIYDVSQNGFTITAEDVHIPPNKCPDSVANEDCIASFVEVIVSKYVPTFFLWIIGPDFKGLVVTARAIAGSTAIPGPACIMTLSGDLQRNGNADWIWAKCQIYIDGYIDARGGGRLKADKIYCGINSCDRKGMILEPPAEFKSPPPEDPWDAVKDQFTGVTSINPGICDYVYEDTAATRFERRSPNPGFESAVTTLKLRPGIHCITSADAWNPGTIPIDGTSGVSLYINKPEVDPPNGSRFIAMTEAQAADNPEFQGLVLYGTGDFNLQGSKNVYAHGAFYFPNGLFEVISNAAHLKHISLCTTDGICPATYDPPLSNYAKCIQFVAGRLNLKADVFNGIENNFDCFDQEPLGPPTQAIVQ